MNSLLELLIIFVFVSAAITFWVIIKTVLGINAKTKKMYYDYGVFRGRQIERQEQIDKILKNKDYREKIANGEKENEEQQT